MMSGVSNISHSADDSSPRPPTSHVNHHNSVLLYRYISIAIASS